MTFSYNIVDEPFVPCTMPDGSREVLGLRETLLHATEIRHVHDPSPLITASLYRLLLAILHRNFGPATLDKWKCLWQDGAGPWDSATLNAYLDRWHKRFDLFDEQRPFHQVSVFTATSVTGIGSLARELASGNNPTLFDHSVDGEPPALEPDAAGRLLVAEQAFGLAGLGGGVVDGKRINFIDGPCARGATVFLQGRDLFQTLMLNLVAYGSESPFPSSPDDAPAWEREPPAGPDRRPPKGYLEYLTWQSRIMRLVPESGPNGSAVVRSLHRMQGLALNEDFAADPFMSYRPSKLGGYMQWRLTEKRAVWRDSGTLLQVHDREDPRTQAPFSFNWVSRLILDGVLPPGSQYNLAVFGLCGKQAKVNLWRHERLPLPLRYLRDADLVGTLSQALGIAEDCGGALRGATRRLAKLVLVPSGSRQADKKAVAALADSLNPEMPFWSRLGTPFRRFYVDLPGDIERQGERLAEWAREVRSTATGAFDEVTRSANLSPRTLKAATQARRQLQMDLAATVNPYVEKGGTE